MCWMCEHPGSTTQDLLNELRAKKLKNGWAMMYVETRTPYAYTIGLHERGLPELLVTGLAPQRAAWLLNHVAQKAVHGAPLMPGERIRLGPGLVIEIVEVEQPGAHMNAAVAFYGSDFRAVQLVWADGRGRWPWAAAFDDGRGTQPVLGLRRQPAPSREYDLAPAA
jgi:Domain of unknown function (DUF4262)